MDPPTLLARLTALGDLARLRMLRLLDREELSVGELSRALQLPQSTVSRHLKPLHDGGWLFKRSEGTASLYRLVSSALDEPAQALWSLAREHLAAAPLLQDDDHRLVVVLAERRTDSTSFFGRLGGDWDHLRRDLFGPLFTAEALLALLHPDWVVADLGCGTGNVAELLSPSVGTVIAVDREPGMLDAARKRLANATNVEFREGDLLSLPIDDGAVDASLIFLVLHHLPAPEQAMQEAGRILKPGGVVLVVDMVEHDREGYRQTMGHKHLGFDPETVNAWADAAGLARTRYRRLRPDTEGKGPGLFVATMYRGH